ncbi:hypothetical protein F5Y03DRAFT_406895 [Xylaria venustula]|nr:hypothetical protein F5Y03DRAFT_406895 [Xylaria venustula]
MTTPLPSMDMGAIAVLSGVAAGATGSNASRPDSFYNRRPRSNPNAVNAASYMNHLRAPAPSRMPGDRGGGVGIHIHYQGRCPHDAAHGPSYPGDGFASIIDGDSCPQDYRSSQYAPDQGSSSSPCGCPRCYWRDFLASDIEKYKVTRHKLRETYLWNLHELVRRHHAAPNKPQTEKDSELEKLYWYYVGRVREVYDNHCEHHRLLFRDVCLIWELPEKITLDEGEEDGATTHTSRALTPHSRHSSGSLRTTIPISRDPTPLSRQSGSRPGVAATEKVNKGKGKEAINVGMGGDSSISATVSVCDDKIGNDKNGKGVEMKIPRIAGPSEAVGKSQPKPNRTSVQQRFRQLWSTKIRDKSSDKTEQV